MTLDKQNLKAVTVAVVVAALAGLKGKAAELYKRADLTESALRYYRAVALALRFTHFMERGEKRADAFKAAVAELPPTHNAGKTPYNILALGLDILKFNLTAADIEGKERAIVNNRADLRDIAREDRAAYLLKVEQIVEREAAAREAGKAARGPVEKRGEGGNSTTGVRKANPADMVIGLETYAGREKFRAIVAGLGLAEDAPAADILNAILAAAARVAEAHKAASALKTAGKARKASAA